MIKILKQPYPSNLLQFEIANILSVVAGLCVFFVLAFLRPFGLASYTLSFVIRDALIFGLVTIISVRLNFSFFKYLVDKGIFIEEKWVVWMEILLEIWLLIFIGICNLITAHLIYAMPYTFSFLIEGLTQTLIVGMFPSLAILAIRQYTLLKKYTSLAIKLDKKISTPPLLIKEQTMEQGMSVYFEDEVSHTDIKVNPNSIIYILAADNYIKIFFFQNNMTQSLLVRGTLKNVEEKLADQTKFYRCHRSYLVNLSYVRHISGNAQGYKLHLEGTEELIPVSRSLNNEIADKVLMVRGSEL